MRHRLHWGLGIAIVYGLFATATTGFGWYAAHQRVELVGPDYYARSLDYDRRMSATANAEALGPAFALDVSEDGRAVSVKWPTEQSDARGSLRLYRASDASADRVFSIAPDGNHTQRFLLDALPAGHWLIQIEWAANGAAYYVERTVTLR